MTIEWTPWFNVPLHRRLELFSVGFQQSCGLLLPGIVVSCMLYALIAGSIFWKTICVLYLAFMYYDRNCGDRGGRSAGVQWFRNLGVWRHCINYFPVDLVKTADLPADRNYLICFFPHGVLSHGASLNFNLGHSKWSTLFPGIRSKLATLGLNFMVPVIRELWLSCGMCSASANSLTTLLQQSNDPADESNRDGYTSNGVGLVVGGAEESFYALSNTYKFVLKRRKGFAKIALKTGASLVPAISFGENELYDLIEHAPGTWGRTIQDTFKRYTKVAPITAVGRGYLQYNFGIIPKRKPITTVIGAPIHVEKNANPSEEEVDKLHDLFCAQIKELFDAHKSKYVKDYEKVHLEFI